LKLIAILTSTDDTELADMKTLGHQAVERS